MWIQLLTHLGLLHQGPGWALVEIPKMLIDAHGRRRPAHYVRLVGEGRTPEEAVERLMAGLS